MFACVPRGAPVVPILAVASLSFASACGPETRDETAPRQAALRVCAGSATTRGIDVSVYQREIDWGRVRGDGVEFGIARISDGLSHADARFDDNWRNMAGAGLVRGAYQYFEPDEDPILQADLVVGAVGELGPGDLPVALDVEVSGGRTSDEIAAHVGSWLDRVEAGTKKAPMIYTASWFWNADVSSASFASRALWVANWGVACPDLPEAWTAWRFWQFDSQSRVAGIEVDVDADWFNGDPGALRRFSGAEPPDGGSDAAAGDADGSRRWIGAPCRSGPAH
jgi:lysozyme